jgi:hypothetical protein
LNAILEPYRMSVSNGTTFNYELPDDDGSPAGPLQGLGWLNVDLSSVGGKAQTYIPTWEQI